MKRPVRALDQEQKSSVLRGYLITEVPRLILIVTALLLIFRVAAPGLVNMRDDLMLWLAYAIDVAGVAALIWALFSIWSRFKKFARRFEAASEQ